MPSTDPSPRPRVLQRLIRGRRTKLRLAGACLVVLGLGYLGSPPARSKVDAAPEPQAETVAPVLQEEIQRREPVRFFGLLRETGLRCLVHTASFPSADPPVPTFLELAAPRPVRRAVSGAGLVVSAEGRILTHVSALAGRSEPEVELPGGERVRGRVVAREPETGLVLIEVPAPSPLDPALPAAAPAAAGEVAIAAAQMGGRELVAPVFVTSHEGTAYTLGSALLVPGLPVFDLDGEALAVAGSAGAPAFEAGAATERLLARLASGAGLGSTIGVSLQPLTTELATRLGGPGVLVADLREGGAAARAGLRAGDVIAAVGDAKVGSPEQALAALAAVPSGETATLMLWRARRRRTV